MPATSSRTPRAMIGGYLSSPPLFQMRLPRSLSAVQPFQNMPWCPRWLSVSTCVPQCVYRWIESPQYEYFSCADAPTPERLSLIEPCGVWVIQIPYGGSPAATQDGIPMKYSTLRSKTWPPPRCSRIALFVSGVIQFSRPISSSGPHGLFETLSPSFSRIGSGISSWSFWVMVTATSLGRDALGLLHEGAVELWPPVAEQVHLVLSRRGDDRLLARTVEVDVGDEQRLAHGVGLGEARAVGSDDLAAAAELRGALTADAIRDQEIDPVLERTRRRQQLGVLRGRHRPIRRQTDDLGTGE